MEGKASRTSREGRAHENATHRRAISTSFRVPSSAFEFGRTIAALPINRIDFDRTGVAEQLVSHVRIESANVEAVKTALRDVSTLDSVSTVDEGTTWILFSVRWRSDGGGFVGYLTASDADVLDVVATPDEWRFECRFGSGEQLRAFHDACLDDDIPIDLLRLCHSPDPVTGTEAEATSTFRGKRHETGLSDQTSERRGRTR